MDLSEALLIMLLILILFVLLSDKSESFVPRIMRRVWDRDLNPVNRHYWYWDEAEHPGLKCVDNCFNTANEQACLQECEKVHDIPTDASYYAMRIRGLTAY